MNGLTQRLQTPVGRERELGLLNQIYQQVLQGEGSRVVFLTGGGGIGKTYLLEYLRRQWAEQGGALLPQRLIDLYDAVHHTVEGFLDALMRVYPASSPFFGPARTAYEEAREFLERARLRQDPRAIRKAREEMLQGTFQALTRVSRRLPLVVFLDTAERWVYRTSPQHVQWAEAWIQWLTWLQEWLSMLRVHLLCVVAGRPERVGRLREQIRASLPEAPSGAVVSLSLEAFSEEEVRRFLEAYGMQDWTGQAAQIRHWTQGHPLLLGLFVEMARRDARRTEELMARGRPEELVGELMNTPEWGMILPQMAVAARGLTPRHLAFMDQGREVPPAQLEPYRRMLEAVGNSIFVKRRTLRSADGTEEEHFFLHDEMYRWVRRAILPSIPSARVQEWLDRLHDISKQEVNRLSRKLGDIYVRLAEGEGAAPAEETVRHIQELETLRHQRETDRLYYSLRRDAFRGLRHYQRMMWSARALGQDEFMRMLQTEMWEYLDEVAQVQEQGFSWFPLPPEDFLDYLRALTDFYPVWTLWASERLAEEEAAGRLQEAETRLRENLEPSSRAYTLARAWLETAYLVRMARLGQYKEAIARGKKHLDEVVRLRRALENQANGDESLREAWRWQCLWSEALLTYTLGFLHLGLLNTSEAVAYLTRAQRLCARLPFDFQEAIAANDGGFALVDEDLQRAEHKVRRAFTLRREWGWGVHMALSLNTLARLRIAAGYYEQARDLARQAQNVLRVLGHPRGLGLTALALAEALRRLGDETPMLSFERRQALYEEAEAQLREAIDRFGDYLGTENLWRAYDHLGRTYRQMAKLFREQAERVPEKRDVFLPQARRYAREARTTFSAARRTAREISGPSGEALAVTSQVNALWLEFYMQEKTLEEMEQAIHEVLRTMEDLCSTMRELPQARATWRQKPPSGSCRYLVLEKGKVMVLLGRTYLHAHFQGQGKEKNLVRQAGRILVEAFEFSRLRGKDYPLLRIAGNQLVEVWMEALHQRRVTSHDLEAFIEGARERARELDLLWEDTYLYRMLQVSELLPEAEIAGDAG